MLTEDRVNEKPSPTQAPIGRAHLDTDRIALAIAVTDARLGREHTPYHMLAQDSPELRSLHGRATVALNMGSQEALDTALTDATMALANQHPHMVRDLVLAEAFAKTVIATWITSMSAQKGGR